MRASSPKRRRLLVAGDSNGQDGSASADFFLYLMKGLGVDVVSPSAASKGGVAGFRSREPATGLKISLEKYFEKNASQTETFLRSLECFWGEEEDEAQEEEEKFFFGGVGGNFRRSILPLEVESEEGATAGNTTSTASGSRMSLVKLILEDERLQTGVTQLLLERLCALGDSSVATSEAILNQLRWLDRVVNSSAMTETIVECLPVLSTHMRREMIGFLPQVAQDSGDIEILVSAFREIMAEDGGMLAPILDALSSVSLGQKQMDGFVKEMLELLDSAEASTLPILVRFIMEGASANFFEDILVSIRHKLFQSLSDEPEAGDEGKGIEEEDEGMAQMPKRTAAVNGKNNDGSSQEALILEQVRQGLLLRWDLCQFFLNNISSCKDTLKKVDVWVLLSLYDSPKFWKKCERIFKQKVLGGGISSALVSRALSKNFAPKRFLAPLLALADSLIRVGGTEVGCQIYRILLSSFSSTELYERQEVLGAVLTHVGSGSGSEVDAALGVLERLSHGDALQPFVPLLKGLLDFIGNLSDEQVGSIFRILSGVLGSRSDDLHIFVRKNCGLPELHQKKIGIIGTVVIISALAREADSLTVYQSCTDEAKALLGDVLRSVSKQADGAAFLYDELRRLLESCCDGQGDGLLGRELLLWLSAKAENLLFRTFFSEEDGVSEDPALKIACKLLRFNGGDDDDGGASLDVITPAASANPNTHLRLKYLCPLLSLVISANRTKATIKGDWSDDVKELLKVALKLPCLDSISLRSAPAPCEQEAIVKAYYSAAEWCRELANGFSYIFTVEEAKRESGITPESVVEKLNCYLSLEADLVRLIQMFPDNDCGFRQAKKQKLGGAPRGGRRGAGRPKSPKDSKGKGKGKAAAVTPLPMNREEELSEGNIRDYLRETMRPFHHRVPLALVHVASDERPGESGAQLIRLLMQELLKSAKMNDSKGKSPVKWMSLYVDAHVFDTLCLEKWFHRDGVTFHKILEMIQTICLLASSSRASEKALFERAFDSFLGEVASQDGRDGDGDMEIQTNDTLGRLARRLCRFCSEENVQVGGDLRFSLDVLTCANLVLNTRNTFVSSSSPPDCTLMNAIGDACYEKLRSGGQNGSDKVIESLVELYLSNSLQPLVPEEEEPSAPDFEPEAAGQRNELPTIERLIDNVLDPFVESRYSLRDVATLSSSTLLCWLKPTVRHLNNLWRSLELNPGRYGGGDTDSAERFVLRLISKLCGSFRKLMLYTKVIKNKPLFKLMLKEGCVFVKALSTKIKFLKSVFPWHTHDVLTLFKDQVQPITRQMHSLVNHALESQDRGMLSLVPLSKKYSDNLLFETKELMDEHNCMGALKVGVLRKREPDGTIVADKQDESSSSEDEDEDGDDEDDDDDTMNDDNDDNDNDGEDDDDEESSSDS